VALLAASSLAVRKTKQSMVMMAKPINTRTVIPDGGGIF